MDRNCKMCKLSTGCAVPGFGPKTPKLIVVSDYPGKKEEEQGRPMVGQAGQLMRRALANLVGLHPDNEIFWTNVIRCRPEDASKIGASEMNACRRWMTEDLRTVECDLILIAGSKAFEALLAQVISQEEQNDNDFELSKAHGRTFYHLGKTYFVTWNPAFVEQNTFKHPDTGKPWHATGSVPWLFKRDMQKLKRLIDDRAQKEVTLVQP